MKLMNLLFGRVIDRRIAEYQNDLIKKHCDEVQNIYKTMRGWRHDYHNHIQTLLALADDEEKTRKYLLDLNADLTCVDTVIKTGNVMVDAILSSKLSLVRSKGIYVNARAVVPSDLQISEIDLCVIIGNLWITPWKPVLLKAPGMTLTTAPDRLLKGTWIMEKRRSVLSVCSSAY